MSDTTAAAEDSFKLYRYEPSIVAAIISVVVFGLLTAGHLWRIYRTRAFYFTAFAIGGICKPNLPPLSSIYNKPYSSSSLRC